MAEPIRITTTEIKDYMFAKLTRQGFAPSEEELSVLTNIFFDYLRDKKIMREVDEQDETNFSGYRWCNEQFFQRSFESS